MKLLQIVLISFFSILAITLFSASVSAHDNSGCGGTYPYACHDGTKHLCSSSPPASGGTCTNGIISIQQAPGCRENGAAMFGVSQSNTYVCDAYCGTLSPQSCPSGRVGKVIGDEGRNICVTVCANACSINSDDTGLTCQNGGPALWSSCSAPGVGIERYVWCSNPPPTPTYPPPPPVTVWARPDTNCGGSIQVYWTATATSPNNQPPSNGYFLYRGTSSGFTPSQSNMIHASIMTNPTSSKPYIDWNEGGTDMNIGTTYYYKVIASDDATGNSTSLVTSSKGSAACGSGATNTPTKTPTKTPTPTGSSGGGTSTPTNTPQPTAPSGQINGRVYNWDTNSGLSGATVRLQRFNVGSGGTKGALTQTTNYTTNSTGNYTFTDTGSGGILELTLTSKGSGRSSWDIREPSNGSTIYTNVPRGSIRNYGLEDPSSPTTAPTSSAPTPTTPSGSCTGSGCGRVTHCTTGAPLEDARILIRRTGSSMSVVNWTDSNGNYRGSSTSPSSSDGNVDIEVSFFGSGNPYIGWGPGTPSSAEYVNIPWGSTRNFTICPSSGPTATPTNTPVPPNEDVTVQVRQQNSNGSTSPLSGATATLYEQSIFGSLTNRGSRVTNSLGVGTWSSLSGGTFGYRITLTDKGAGRSAWPIVAPSSGLNYYSNVPLGSSRTFLLQASSATATPTTPAGFNYDVGGRILSDTDNNMCATGSTLVTDATVRLYGGGSQITSATSGNAYRFTGSTSTSAPHALTITRNNYEVVGVQNTAPGGYVAGNFSPYTNSSYVLSNFSTDSQRDVYFCMREITVSDTPWFMTEIGSVRQQRISNPVPSALAPTTANNTASVFYSTAGITFLGEGHDNFKWQVDDEYNATPGQDRPGNASYSFYKNRSETTGTQMYTITSPFTADIDTLVPNRVYHVDGDLTFTGNSTINGAKRFVFLADGDITINGNVTVNHPNSLVIFAAKEDLVIGSSVGRVATSNAYNIQAILTAENDIIIDGAATCPVADLRLNIEGSLVANSDNPFGEDTGGGILDNRRSLCAQNELYPSLYVKSRLSFITELSDFYKVSSRFWNEIAP